MKYLILAIFAALAACALPAGASDFRGAVVTFQSGDWRVLRTQDPMTDRATCTGIYRGDFGIQLAPERLYVSVSGSVSSVRLRFDDEPARQVRLATPIERRIRAIAIEGPDFFTLVNATRLRYRVTTLLDDVKDGDIDLTGMRSALDHIRAGCQPARSSL